jgi:hypothetical protein
MNAENFFHPEFVKGFQSSNQMVMMLEAILNCAKGPLFFENIFILRKMRKRMLIVFSWEGGLELRNRIIPMLVCGVLGMTGLMTSPILAASEPFVGEIMMTGANFCPRGWVNTDGQLLPN